MRIPFRKQIIGITLLSALFLAFGGCKAFEIVTDQQGNQQTKIEQDLETAADLAKQVGGAANNFVPGAGLVASGLAAIMGLIGHGITSFVVSRKRKDALTAVVQGVEDSSDKFYDLSHAVLDILSATPDLKGRVEKVINQFITPKKAIQQVSEIKGNKIYLDKHVQKITHSMKRG